MCRLSVVCESVQGKRKQALFALQWLVSFCLRRCRSTNQLTNTHKYTLCCRRLPSASGWLTPADLTREPESECSVPACTLTRMKYKTHVRALAAFAGSLIGLIMIFLLSSGDFTRPNKAVSPSWPSLDLSFSSHRHTTMFSSPFLSYEIREEG